MAKVNKLLLGLVMVLVVGLVAVLYRPHANSQQAYYAVAMNTGELFFGKLNRFPRVSLSDVWLPQPAAGDKKGLRLVRYRDTFWGPEDRLELNARNVVWKAKLSDGSQVLNFIKNPPPPQAAQQGPLGQFGPPQPEQANPLSQPPQLGPTVPLGQLSPPGAEQSPSEGSQPRQQGQSTQPSQAAQ